MMGHHRFLTEALLQGQCDPLGPSAAEREDQRGAMLADQIRDAVVHRVPMRMGRQWAQFRPRRQHLQIQFTRAVARCHNPAWTLMTLPAGIDLAAGQEAAQFLNRAECRRKSNSDGPRSGAGFHHPLQPLQGQRQMRAALVAGHRMQLIDDDPANRLQLLTETAGGQQDEQRLRRGDEDLRRTAQHRAALARGSIAGAQPGANRGQGKSATRRGSAHSAQWLLQVQPDIVGQRLERGDVKHRHLVGEESGLGLDDELVDRPQKGRQRLAAAGGSAQQGVVPAADQRPSQFLDCRRPAQTAFEPGSDQRMERGYGGTHPIFISCRNQPMRDLGVGPEECRQPLTYRFSLRGSAIRLTWKHRRPRASTAIEAAFNCHDHWILPSTGVFGTRPGQRTASISQRK